MRHDDHGRAFQPFLQNLPGLAVEFGIRRGRHALVDKIDVEFQRQQQREHETLPHPRRIGADRHIEIFIDIGQPSREGGDIIWVEPVDAGDETGVFIGGMLADHAAHKSERERYPAIAPDRPLIRLFETAHHVDDRGLAGSVRGQNTQRAAQIDAKRCAVKDHLALRSRRRIWNIVEFQHGPPWFAANRPER